MFAILGNKGRTANRYLRPIGGLHSFFSCYACDVGAQQVQDMIEYNKHYDLFDCFKKIGVVRVFANSSQLMVQSNQLSEQAN